MTPITIKEGDILLATEKFIAHQCNCVTQKAATGVASAIFTRFPYSEVYLRRETPSTPGSVTVHEPPVGTKSPTIVNIYSQRYPGKSKWDNDTNADRLEWIEEGLLSFIERYRPDAIALPYLIGCGQAAGHWPTYLKLLEEIQSDTSTKLVLYRQ